MTPESFMSKFNIDMKIRHEVRVINPDEKVVVVKNLKSRDELEESYDKLLLAQGARPVIIKISGFGLKNLFSLILGSAVLLCKTEVLRSKS